ncbi:MAG: FAD-dependent oxidoreductase, partial [Clostridia bacterium]|nr:FAD-dependent oxidoreductase [Clostridia bacterium]
MLYTKEIEKNEHFDIVVIGGGVAGFCAAVAAGRMGKRVALIEDMGALGGIMTTGGNPQIGIFFAYYKQAIAGIGWELCKNLEAMGFADIPDFTTVDTRKGSEPSNVKVCMPMAEAEMNRMCKEAGVALFFHSKLIDVITENS